MSKKRITLPSKRARILQEYADPLAYLDAPATRRLFFKCLIIALLYIVVGSILLAAILTADYPGRGADNGGFLTFMLAVGALLYGLFRLFTIRRSMIAARRRRLEHL